LIRDPPTTPIIMEKLAGWFQKNTGQSLVNDAQTAWLTARMLTLDRKKTNRPGRALAF